MEVKHTFEWKEFVGKAILKIENSYSNELIVCFTDDTKLSIITEDESLNILYEV